jgi:hypothetical protein
MNVTKSYDSLPWILRVIFQIFFGWIISPVYRILRLVEKGGGNILILILYVLLYIVFGVVLWWIDFFTVLFGLGIVFLVP